MDNKYRSIEQLFREMVSKGTEARRKVPNVGRPDTAANAMDPKSTLYKQGQIQTKIVDEAKTKKEVDEVILGPNDQNTVPQPNVNTSKAMDTFKAGLGDPSKGQVLTPQAQTSNDNSSVVKESSAHKMAKAMVKGWRGKHKAELHPDGTATVHVKGGEHYTSANAVDSKLKHHGFMFNHPEKEYDNHKQSMNGHKVHVTKTAKGHSIHIASNNVKEEVDEGYIHIGSGGNSPYDKWGDKRPGTRTLGNDSKWRKRDKETRSPVKKNINDRLTTTREEVVDEVSKEKLQSYTSAANKQIMSNYKDGRKMPLSKEIDREKHVYRAQKKIMGKIFNKEEVEIEETNKKSNSPEHKANVKSLFGLVKNITNKAAAKKTNADADDHAAWKEKRAAALKGRNYHEEFELDEASPAAIDKDDIQTNKKDVDPSVSRDKKDKGNMNDKDAKIIKGGKTEVDLEPKTDDSTESQTKETSDSKKARNTANKQIGTKGVKEETMRTTHFGLPESLVTSVNEVMKGKQKKLDKNHNGKIDGQDFKMLRKEDNECGCKGNCKCSTNEEIEQVDEAATPLHRVYLRQTTARHKSVHAVDANGKVKTLSGPTNFMDAASTAEKHAKKHGLVKHDGEWVKSANEEIEQVDELTGIKKSPLKKIGYVMKAGKRMTQTAPHEIANNPDTARKFGNTLKTLKKMNKEEVEFSEDEIARIETIAKGL